MRLIPALTGTRHAGCDCQVMRVIVYAGWSLVALAMLACQTASPATPSAERAGAEQSRASEAASGNLTRMKELQNQALVKLDEGAIAQGIRLLVSVLATKGQSQAEQELISDVEAELTRIASALSLDSDTEWLDDNKNQLIAGTEEVGRQGGLQPSVILTYNMGVGRTLVPGAPIQFEFVKGSGLLTRIVTTNEYGQATCSLAQFDDPNSENIVRASVVFTVGGYAHRFSGKQIDFTFAPPARKATIMVLETSPLGAADDPIILDGVFNVLKGLRFDFSHHSGLVTQDEFLQVFGGDAQAIRAVGLQKEVSYLVMVYSDCHYLKQLELSGKVYNIFSSKTQATVRIVRVRDGKIMYSTSIGDVQGQGGNSQKAVIDGHQKAAQEMAAKLAGQMPEIGKVLSVNEADMER